MYCPLIYLELRALTHLLSLECTYIHSVGES